MTDLNVLTPADSSLYLLNAQDINSQGEIVGTALDLDNGEPVAFMAVPCGQIEGVQACSDAAPTAVGVQRPKVVLPDYIRTAFRHPLGLFR